MKKLIVLIFLLSINYSYSQSTPVLMSGFPIILDSLDLAYNNGPIVADFNNDGENEILIGVNSFSLIGKVLLINKEGNSIQNFPKIVSCINSYIWIAAGDINNDGFIDIVVKSDSLYVFDYQGNYLPGFPMFTTTSANDFGDRLGLYDLDNDKYLEIISVKKNVISVVNYDGSIRPGWPKTIDISGNTRISYFAVGDLNNDNLAEIILPVSNNLYQTPNLDSNKIFILEPDGSQYLSSPIISDSNYYFESFNYPIIYSENNQKYFTILSNYSPTRIPGNFKTRLTKYDENGNIVFIKNLNTNFLTESMTMGRLNNDEPFFLFGNLFNQTFAFNQTGELMSGFPISTPNEQYRNHNIGKLTDKFCFGSSATQDTLGGMGLRGYLKYWNTDGNQLPWSPLRPKGIPGTAASYYDLDNDGQAEILSTTSYFINGEDGCGLYVWTLPGVPFSDKNFPWQMYGHDRYRTNQYGFIPPDEPVGIQPISTNVPDKLSLSQNYPNPFNPATTIKFDIRTPAFTKLSVFDVLGREIKTLVKEELKTGSYSLVFDGSEFNSGVYFYRLTSGDFVETKRMLMVK